MARGTTFLALVLVATAIAGCQAVHRVQLRKQKLKLGVPGRARPYLLDGSSSGVPLHNFLDSQVCNAPNATSLICASQW